MQPANETDYTDKTDRAKIDKEREIESRQIAETTVTIPRASRDHREGDSLGFLKYDSRINRIKRRDKSQKLPIWPKIISSQI